MEAITRGSVGVKEMLFISLCYANSVYILDGMEKTLEGKHKLLNFRERRKETEYYCICKINFLKSLN